MKKYFALLGVGITENVLNLIRLVWFGIFKNESLVVEAEDESRGRLLRLLVTSHVGNPKK
jgi:hypothetical protein